MPTRQKKSMAAPLKAVDIAALSKATPYIQRIIQDAKLRENVRVAYDSSRSAYARLTNGKAPAKALLEDKRLQRDLQHAVEALREATTALAEPPKRARKRLRFTRKLMIAALAFGLALAGSEKLRTKVLDTVFGKEEEFEYTPPPATASTPPSSPVGAA
jgi:glutamine synthetase adenylyltransferase